MNFRHTTLFFLNILCLLAVLILGSCKEEFPPYTEPANVLQGNLQVISPDTVHVHSLSGSYYFDAPLTLRTTITNVHDDLLQGTALIGGTISLQSFSAVPRAFVVPLALGDLRSPPVVQGNIALGPGRQAEFSVLWVPFAADGEIVFAGLPFVQIDSDKLFGPIDFIASAEVQLFERVQPIQVPSIQFSLVFRVSDLAVPTCAPDTHRALAPH